MFSVDKLPLYIQEFSSIGQILLTIALFVATLIYVIFTKKILDQNYSTFVVLMDLKRSEKTISANIENHGTEIALNVSIVVSSDKLNATKTKLKGPRMLLEGEKVIYHGELTSETDHSDLLLTIRYQSHTRWPRKEFWKIKDDKIVFVGNKKVFKKYLYSDE